MMDGVQARQVEEARTALKDLAVLEANPVWQEFAKQLQGMAAAAAESHEDVRISAVERAEHLHEMKATRALAAWLEEKRAWLRKRAGRQ